MELPIVERLRSFEPRTHDPWAICDEAADTIERLTQESAQWEDAAGKSFVRAEQLEDRVEAAEALITELVAALEPFAALATLEESRYENCVPPDALLVAVFLSNLRKARAVLARARSKGGE